MTFLDLLTAEHNRLHSQRAKESRAKKKHQFTDEMISLCSLLDKIQVFPSMYPKDYEEHEDALELLK